MTDNDTFLGNIEAEEAILGGILLDPKAISEVADILPIEAFCFEAHQIIYQAALTLHNKDKPTDLVAVSNYLSDQKLIKKIGTQAKLAQLLNRTVSAVNIDRYAALVLNKYQRRQLVHIAHEIAELGYDTTTELEKVFDSVEEKIFNPKARRQGCG